MCQIVSMDDFRSGVGLALETHRIQLHQQTIFNQSNPRCALRIVEETSSSRYLALEKLLLRDDSARWVSLSPVIAGFN